MTADLDLTASLPNLPRVELIVFCEKGSDALQWKAAELIADELADGKSQRELAGEIGKSQTHVGRMARVWASRESLGTQPFNEAYHSAEIRGPAAAGPKPSSPAISSRPQPIPAPNPVTEPDDTEPVDGEVVEDEPEDSSSPEITGCPVETWGKKKSGYRTFLRSYADNVNADQARDLIPIVEAHLRKLQRKVRP